MSKETNSKDTTGKKDEEVAAKNIDLQNLKGEVGILKQYITKKATEEEAKTKKDTEATYQKNRLSKNISGLSSLEGLTNTLGKQQVKLKKS